MQRVDYLSYLWLGRITINQDGFESTTGYYPSFHNLGVSGQYHPVFSQSLSY